jgi:UDP-glucose 6-dehydrogenase
MTNDEAQVMLDTNILNQLHGASIEDRIAVIEMILKSLKQDLRASNAHSVAEQHPLRGKVRYYEDPYESVAAEDWEASA